MRQLPLLLLWPANRCRPPPPAQGHGPTLARAHAYTRILLDLPMEKDFYQPHLLLLPKGQGREPFPAVVAWTSTTPDLTAPEQWWGAWLAEREAAYFGSLKQVDAKRLGFIGFSLGAKAALYVAAFAPSPDIPTTARTVLSLFDADPRRPSPVLTDDGHHPNGPAIDPAWRAFFERWLKPPLTF